MQFQAERGPFNSALTTINKVVERRSTIPILSFAHLHATQDKVTIIGTDLDIEIRADVPADVKEPGTIALPASMLRDLVAKSPDGAVVKVSDRDNGARVESGRARFQVQTLPADEFPTLPEWSPSHRFQIPAAQLLALIAPCRHAISNEETRYYLNGVFLATIETPAGRMLTAVATDGHRLSLTRLPAPEGSADMPAIIVPTKTIDRMVEVAKASSGSITIEVDDRRIGLAADDLPIRLSSKLIDGTYPDFLRVIPTGGTVEAEIDRELLAAVADRVTTISAADRGRAIRFTWKDQAVTLTVQNPEAGSAEETIDIRLDGDPIEIGFNGRYLGEALAVLPTERVRIRMTDPGSPALLEPVSPPVDAPGQLIVLMPMRV